MEVQMTFFGTPIASQQMRRARPARHRKDGRGRHMHSIESHERIERVMGGRCSEILRFISGHGAVTAREVLHGLFPGSDNMNLVRPRITELLNSGRIVECGQEKDPETGMTVAQFSVY